MAFILSPQKLVNKYPQPLSQSLWRVTMDTRQLLELMLVTSWSHLNNMRVLRIGFLLGFRQIQRANYWTTALIIFVMMLTFLNLIAVSGILVGLIAGSERAVQE